MIFFRTQRGFTALEMVIYTGILAAILASVITLLLFVVSSNTKVRAVRATIENAKNVVNTMTNEIREASSIYTPTTSANQLSLETTKNLPSGETSTYVDFFLCGTRLCIKRESANPIAITTNNVEVTSFSIREVTTLTVQSVQIAFTIEYENPGSKSELEASISATTTVSLRAY